MIEQLPQSEEDNNILTDFLITVRELPLFLFFCFGYQTHFISKPNYGKEKAEAGKKHQSIASAG